MLLQKPDGKNIREEARHTITAIIKVEHVEVGETRH